MVHVIGFVPARAGSTGIPNKNTIRGPKIDGKPLIDRTVETAIEALGGENVFISTNDPGTFHHFKEKGFESRWRENEPGYREASMKEVLTGFIMQEGMLDQIDNVAFVVLYPTYQDRTAADIRSILSFYEQAPANPVIGAKKPKTHPYRCFRINPDSGTLEAMFKDQFSISRRQEYPTLYEFCHFACVIPGPILHEMTGNLIHANSRVWWVPENRGKDLDSMKDLENAGADF